MDDTSNQGADGDAGVDDSTENQETATEGSSTESTDAANAGQSRMDTTETEAGGSEVADGRGGTQPTRSDFDGLTRGELSDRLVSELRALASQEIINLKGRDKKDDIVETIWNELVNRGEVAEGEEGLADMAGGDNTPFIPPRPVDGAAIVSQFGGTEEERVQEALDRTANLYEAVIAQGNLISSLLEDVGKLHGRGEITKLAIATLQKNAGIKSKGTSLHGKIDDLKAS